MQAAFTQHEEGADHLHEHCCYNNVPAGSLSKSARLENMSMRSIGCCIKKASLQEGPLEPNSC